MVAHVLAVSNAREQARQPPVCSKRRASIRYWIAKGAIDIQEVSYSDYQLRYLRQELSC